MKQNKGGEFYVKFITYAVITLIIIWWVNGCSTTWLEHRPSKEERQRLNDSIREQDSIYEKEMYVFNHSEIDERTDSSHVRIVLRGRRSGNEFDAIPDIVVKKWSDHNGNIEACRKQFIETELKLHGVAKIPDEYFHEITFSGNIVNIYTTTQAFSKKNKMDNFAKKLRTKVRNCGCKHIRFYYISNKLYREKYPPKLIAEYTDNGDEFELNEGFRKEWTRNCEQEQRDKANEYSRYLDNK